MTDYTLEQIKAILPNLEALRKHENAPDPAQAKALADKVCEIADTERQLLKQLEEFLPMIRPYLISDMHIVDEIETHIRKIPRYDEAAEVFEKMV